MKTFIHILTIVLVMSLIGCDDTTYSDPHRMPVRVPGLHIPNISLVKPLSDGTVVLPVLESDGVKIAKVMRDGIVAYSELAAVMECKYFRVNTSGECLVADRETVVKFDRLGNVTVNSEIVDDDDVNGPLLLDNGDICYVNWNENNEMVLNTLGSNFPYVIKNGDWVRVQPFDDKCFAFNENLFGIYDADGNELGKGELEGMINTVQYIDGYLYVIVIVSGGITNPDTEFDFIEKRSVLKMSTDGRIIYSAEIENSDIYNLTVHNGKLIVTGDVIQEIAKDGNYGEIYIVDDINGNLISKISTDNYNGCSVIPIYVSLDQNGEYDVYAARRENYESDESQLVIYHTDDLIKLNIEN
ncbi:MAG: hypothetical protein J6T96_16200 [Bacteroidales bacterium]|nr:hypothetical protein [Bacteroidales bacterium]